MRPEHSITGHSTADVSAQALAEMMKQLQRVGRSFHAADAADVWAVTQECERRHIPYEVLAAKDGSGTVKAVAVQDSRALIDDELPAGWSIEVLHQHTAISKPPRPF